MKASRQLPRLDHFKAYSASTNPVEAAYSGPAPEALTPRERTASHICCFIAAAIMIETLFFKFSGAAESVYIFRKMGTEPWMRWVQGTWELIASICLIFPSLRWAGGMLTVGAMGAAIISHMTWLGFAVRGDHGLLFGMAVTTFACGFVTMMLHRHSIPLITTSNDW